MCSSVNGVGLQSGETSKERHSHLSSWHSEGQVSRRVKRAVSLLLINIYRHASVVTGRLLTNLVKLLILSYLCVSVCVCQYARHLLIVIMEICKAPTLRLKALNKHSITHIMYI